MNILDGEFIISATGQPKTGAVNFGDASVGVSADGSDINIYGLPVWLQGPVTTTAYTPSIATHLATKKYVDDSVAGGGGGVTPAALTKVDDTNVTLTLGGTPATALLQATSITAGWSGSLAATRGGTGQSSYAVGDLLYASTTSALSKLADVATGNALISGGVGAAPSWGKINLTSHVSSILPAPNGGTGISSFTVGDMLYASTAANLSALAAAASGNVLTSNGVGVGPSWGKVNLATHVTGTMLATNGGTGHATYAVGDLLYGAAGNTLARLADVATGSALISGGVTTAPSWGKINLAASGHVTGILPVANGGTGSATAPYVPLVGGVNLTGNIGLNIATGAATLSLISNQASQSAVVDHYQGGTNCWRTGKQTNNSYIIHDMVSATTPVSIPSNGTSIEFTRDLNFTKSNPAIYLKKTTSGFSSFIMGQLNTTARWAMALGDNAAESSGNAGSDFKLWRYNDAGTQLDAAMTINRATAAVGFTGSISAGDIYANRSANSGCCFLGSSGLHYVYYDGASYNMPGGQLTLGGDLVAANIYLSGGVNAGGSVWVNNGGAAAALYFTAGTNYIYYAGGAYSFNANSVGAIMYAGSMQSSAECYKPGGGPWAATSDVRIKTVVADYTAGLSAIAELKPVRYKYKGNDTREPPKQGETVPYTTSQNYEAAMQGKEYIGFRAQQIEDHFPELVSQASGYIDGVLVHNLRRVDTNALIYALVNSVQELAASRQELLARVEKLERSH